MEEKLDKELIPPPEKEIEFDDEETKEVVENYGSTDEAPFISANFFSRFFLFWAYKVLKLGNLIKLKAEYFGKLKGNNSCVTYLKNMKNIWEVKGYKLKKSIPLIKAGFRANLKYVIIVLIFFLIKTLITLLSLDLFREYMKRFGMTKEELENNQSYYRYFSHTEIGIICLGIKLFEIFFDRRCNEYQTFMAFKTSSEFQCLLYEKLIKVSPSSMKERAESGEVINFMNIDAHRITVLMKNCPEVLTIPMNLIGYSYMLFTFFGFSFIFGILTLLFFMFINVLFSQKFKQFRKKQMLLKDKRMRKITETFDIIKTLKLYAWEEEFKKKITESRENELQNLERIFKTQNLNSTIQWFAPVATIVVTIGVYQRYHDKLKIEDIMTSLRIFNSIQEPIRSIPELVNNFNEFAISMKRIEKYLFQDEINPGNVIKKDKYMDDNNLSIKIVNGNFSWGIPPTSLAEIKMKELEEKSSKKKSQKNFQIPQISSELKDFDNSEKLTDLTIIKSNTIENNELDSDLGKNELDEEIYIKEKINPLKPILKDINCEIKKGEFVCVIGNRRSR